MAVRGTHVEPRKEIFQGQMGICVVKWCLEAEKVRTEIIWGLGEIGTTEAQVELAAGSMCLESRLPSYPMAGKGVSSHHIFPLPHLAFHVLQDL